MRSTNEITRRGLMGSAAAALALSAVPAAALTTQQATSLIQQVVTETMAVVNSGASTDQALRQFEQIMRRYGDMPIVARSVLGQPWRTASGAQQSAFVEAFTGYVSRKYGREFREYRGASMTVTGATDQGSKGVVVNSVVNFPGDAPVAVDWQVSDASGSPKLFNLFIEGISMLSTERSEVRAIYEANRSNIDALIQDLQRRG